MSTVHSTTSKLKFAGLALGALGIVYGDIGTSPLYAINEIFFGHAHMSLTKAHILGVISIVVWAIITIISFKYMIFVLRADNQKEGGLFALLAHLKGAKKKRSIAIVSFLLVLAAGFLYGDGIITPAISVLSAVEGLNVIAPQAANFVIPITLTILLGLFAVQRRGTAKVGAIFGPIMIIWFGLLAFLGTKFIIDTPTILQAFNPVHGIRFAHEIGIGKIFLVLGSVMLVVTGGEAVFADMGHFGRSPIRLSWFSVVMPALLLNYLGQGAYLLSGREITDGKILYSMVPHDLLIPVVILATIATVIASQALISGAFSLTSQAIALKLLPRMKTHHTHAEHEGQIYLPGINWLLFIGCAIIVLGFKTSTALAAAYGLAVSVDMVITSLAMFFVAKQLWHWSNRKAGILWIPLLLIDLLFLTANSLKFFKGGFVPVGIGAVLAIIMTTWSWGRNHIDKFYASSSKISVGQLLKMRGEENRSQFPKSLLVLTPHFAKSKTDKIAPLLDIFIDQYHSLPKHIISLTVEYARQPHVNEDDRFEIVTFENDRIKDQSIISIRVKFGFMENPSLPTIIKTIAENPQLVPDDDIKDWIIYVGRQRIRASQEIKQSRHLRYQIFKILSRNSQPSYEYFGLGDDLRISMHVVPVTLQ